MILPLFGFANAGVALSGMTADDLMSPVPVGVALGLFVGKQAGIFRPVATGRQPGPGKTA
jgi:NhaA family Na+:H+ antiporter